MLAARIEEMARRIAERHELQAALARGDRLATVGVMSASVAHEINNPLTTVLGYSRLLLEDKPDDHPDRAGLELIGGEAERMKAIVSGLLDYARVEKETRGPTDLAVVIRHCAALVQPTLRRARASLELDLAADLPEVAADAHALQQVLVNLFQNAAQAMQPAGGAVRRVRHAVREISRSWSRSATRVRASPPASGRGSSTRSTRPRRPGSAPGSASRSASTWSRRSAARSTSARAQAAVALASAS